jgi:hypothetical protein
MNPVEHPVRVLTALVLAVSFGAAAFAWAATHTVADFNHGLTGPNCGPQLQNCTFFSPITDTDGTYPNATLSAGNYHWTGSSWNTQCFLSEPHRYTLKCSGASGTLPCQKYAHNSGTDPTSALPWHGHNPATICA